MQENPRIPMPFGSGLDRDTGIMAVRPGTFEDIRNVLLHQGKAIIRPGFGSALALLDPAGVPTTDVVAGFPLRSEFVGIVVSYQAAGAHAGKVFVHRIDSDGLSAWYVGEWVNDQVTPTEPTGWGSTPPRVFMAESYGKVFLAHDTRFATDRAQTVYYDAGTLTYLISDDWGGRGDEPVRFRGVVRHLNYMFGWGFGTTQQDRPEIVRSSVAGDPTTFRENHYSIAGNQRVGVLLCAPAGRRLLVLKESETYVIEGSSRADFSIKILDPLYGIRGSHLGVNYGGNVIAWGLEGPRIFDGIGSSAEISIPLDLGGLEPATLVAEGEVATAFAHYVPDMRVVVFVFGQRVYALTVRIEGDWKWSYWELGFTPLCGFTLFAGSVEVTAPTGFPEYTSAAPAGTYIDATITNRGQDGDETLEMWVQEDPAGAWTLANPDPVKTTSTQVIRGSGLIAGTVYNMAFRYRRGNLYTVGYDSATPSDWPLISQGQTTTTINPPTPVSGVWARTSGISEEIVLTCTPAAGLEANDIEVFEDAVSIGTISGPHSGDAVFTHDTANGLAGEAAADYTFVTLSGGGSDSPPSAPLNVYAGPAPPVQNWQQATGPLYQIGFTRADAAFYTEAWDNYDDAGGTGAFGLRATTAQGASSVQSGALVNVPSSPGVQIDLKVRHKQTLFAVDDYSVYSSTYSVTLVDPWV